MKPIFASSLWFAHGDDPQALPWHVLLSDWILACCVFGCCLFLVHRFLIANSPDQQVSESTPEQASQLGKEVVSGPESAGWAVIALGMLAATSIWITRQSLYEGIVAPPPPKIHQHVVYNGGQLAMWGDYHLEIARHISGEYRLWFFDGYARTIGARFFQGTIFPRNPKTGFVDEEKAVPLEFSLDDLYVFAILPPEQKSIQVRLAYPSGTIKLNFVFDESVGKRSLREWCGPVKGTH